MKIGSLSFSSILFLSGFGVGTYSIKLLEHINPEDQSMHIFMIILSIGIGVMTWIDLKKQLKL